MSYGGQVGVSGIGADLAVSRSPNLVEITAELERMTSQLNESSTAIAGILGRFDPPSEPSKATGEPSGLPFMLAGLVQRLANIDRRLRDVATTLGPLPGQPNGIHAGQGGRF